MASRQSHKLQLCGFDSHLRYGDEVLKYIVSLLKRGRAMSRSRKRGPVGRALAQESLSLQVREDVKKCRITTPYIICVRPPGSCGTPVFLR